MGAVVGSVFSTGASVGTVLGSVFSAGATVGGVSGSVPSLGAVVSASGSVDGSVASGADWGSLTVTSVPSSSAARAGVMLPTSRQSTSSSARILELILCIKNALL